MASKRLVGATARTSGTRLLCQHGAVYPCDECRVADPRIEAGEAAREAADAYDRALAAARGSAETLRNRMVDGDWVGCFECKALDSQYVGQRMLLVFDKADFDKAKLGDRAPDTKTFGPGWKFLLDAKTESADDAAAWLFRVGDYR